MKVDLSRYNNTLKKSKFKESIWYLINILFFINPLNPFSILKVYILRLFGAKIGRNIIIKPGVSIKYPWLLIIGSNVWIGENVWVDNLEKVIIEDNVCISQGAMLLCGNHDYKKPTFDLIVGAIHIKEGAWIGAKSIVCPNITVNSHAILSVNSVANSNLESYSVYKGNPAVKIRDRKINSSK